MVPSRAKEIPMKWWSITAALSLVLSSHAFAASVTASGHVTYKMPSGELVTRSASLEVPARGEGKVILRSGDVEVEAKAFRSHKVNGRIVFNVLFIDPPGAPENTAALFSGTYSRGSNRAIYYGDFYSKVIDPDGDLAAETSELSSPDLLRSGRWTYQGGFGFQAETAPAGSAQD